MVDLEGGSVVGLQENERIGIGLDQLGHRLFELISEAVHLIDEQRSVFWQAAIVQGCSSARPIAQLTVLLEAVRLVWRHDVGKDDVGVVIRALRPCFENGVDRRLGV